MVSSPNLVLDFFNWARILSVAEEGINRTLADLPETLSTTVMADSSISGPVMANGERFRPLRRHASAAAVAMGPGIPFTMTRISSEDAIWRDVEKARFVLVGANAAAWIAKHGMMEVGANNFILL